MLLAPPKRNSQHVASCVINTYWPPSSPLSSSSPSLQSGFNFDVRNSRGTHYIFSFFQLLFVPSLLGKFLMRLTPMNLFNFSAPQNVIKFNATLPCADPHPPPPLTALLAGHSRAQSDCLVICPRRLKLWQFSRPVVSTRVACQRATFPMIDFHLERPFLCHIIKAPSQALHITRTHTNTHTSHTHRQPNICMSTMLPSIVYSRQSAVKNGKGRCGEVEGSGAERCLVLGSRRCRNLID